MPILKKPDGWYWGSHGPFPTKQKAVDIGRAAHAHGFKEDAQMNPNATAEFIATLLHSATVTHFMHLQVEGEGGLGGLGGEAGGEKDPMYDQAVEVVLKNRKASISLVQRHLKIGYNRAARLVEDMENAGLVSAMNGQGQREILVPNRAAE